MRLGTQVGGLITLNHGDRRHEYTPEEIALAMALGKFTILAIERERLLREREEAQSSGQAIRAPTQHIDAIPTRSSHELETPLPRITRNTSSPTLPLRTPPPQNPPHTDH